MYTLPASGSTTAAHQKIITKATGAFIAVMPVVGSTDLQGEILAVSATRPLGKTVEEAEEKEWEAFIAQPEIQQGFSRLADKMRADIAAGKFEEGEFAVE